MSLLNRLFSKNLFSDTDRNSRRLKRNVSKSRSDADLWLQVEKLEEKIALAAQSFSFPDDGGALDGGRHVIVLDSNTDDLYFRVTQETVGIVPGGGPQVIEQIAFDTDPNFSNPQHIEHNTARYQDLLITNAVSNSVAGDFSEDPERRFNSESNFTIDLQTALEAGVTPPNTVSSSNAVVPGTLSGSLFIRDARGGDTVFFTTRLPHEDFTINDDLVFSINGDDWADSVTLSHSVLEVADDGKVTISDKSIAVDGTYSYSEGAVFIDFDGGGDPFPLFESRGGTSSVTFASPIIPDGPSTVRLAPGLDFNLGLQVDLPSENSIINIASPVEQNGADNLVVLAATAINIDAPITSNQGFYTIGSAGSLPGSDANATLAGDWYGGGGAATEIEAVTLSAPITAPDIGLIIKDDQQTSQRSRGVLYVAPTSGLLGAARISIDTTHADIIFEGNVSGTVQSYMFRTRTESTPYKFVTNQGVGLPSGLISGSEVDVTLSNEQPLSALETVTHDINLDTDVESLRIAAAGDDSFGFNDTGIVTAVQASNGSQVTLTENAADIGIEIGDSILGNVSDGVVPTPVVANILPDETGSPQAAGRIEFASPVNLAAGSVISVTANSAINGFPIEMASTFGLTTGQVATYFDAGLGSDVELGSVRDVDVALAGRIVTLDQPAAVNPAATGVLEDTIITFTREDSATVRADTVNDIDDTTTNVLLFDVAGIAEGMTVSQVDNGVETLLGTVTFVSELDEIIPSITIDAVVVLSEFDTLEFEIAQQVAEDRNENQVTLSSLIGVTEGMTITAVDSGQSASISTVEGEEIVGSVVTLTTSAPVGWLADADLLLQSPNLTVTAAVSQSSFVPVDTLVGVVPNASANIPAANISAGVIVTSINGNDIIVSEDLALGAGSSVTFGRLQQNEYYRYAINVTEQDALNLDATVSSGGPVAISSGGDLTVNASLQSHGDVSLTSSGNVVGNAWLVTREGTLSIQGAAVSLNGDARVLASPFDESITDVVIASTSGSVAFTGSVGAVNRVLVEQAGTGNVSVQGVAVASEIEVYSEGSVDLATNANRVLIDAGAAVTVAEQDQAFFEIESPGRITISAAGVDGSDSAALVATIRESANLVLSAPAGSIDVSALSPSTMTIGESELLLAGVPTQMQAAGNVSIRSGQEEVIVLDAPIAGDGRLQTRAVATGGLGDDGDYAVNNPGVAPTTLTAGLPQNLNTYLTANPGVMPGFGGEGLSLRVRDSVLLTNQSDAKQNGLYQVMSLGSTTTPWSLRRLGFADTTAELPENSRIRVQDGPSEGDVFVLGAYGNAPDETPLRVTAGTDRSATELTVSLATDTALDGVFAGGDGLNPATITGTSSGLVINGIGVQDDEFVLVRHGCVDETVTGAPSWDTELSWPSNGVYQKLTENGTWVLRRLQLVTGAVVDEATVVVEKGIYRTSATGDTFTVAFDGLGLSNLPIAIDEVTTEIGSYDPRDPTTFVVTTAGVSNDAAGSLGKMLSLVDANDARDLTDEVLEQSIQFANVLGSPSGTTGTILLQQELPTIEKAISLDTTSRYQLQQGSFETIVIDGSRITSTRGGAFVSSTTPINGLEYKDDAGTSITVDGFEIPEEPTIGELRGVRLVGFDQGGAVVVNGVSNFLIENVTVGLDASNASRSSLYGIQVIDSGSSGPVTLLSNSIFASSILTGDRNNPLDGAGVQIEGSAQGVQIVNSTIGSASASNTVGVVFESTNDNTTRANSIGVNPIPTEYLVELDTEANKATLTIPNDIWADIGKDLHLGQSVAGTGIATGSEIIFINPNEKEIVLSDRMIDSGSASVTFGAPGRTTITENFFGVDLRSGNSRMVNTTVSDNVISGIRVGVDTSEDTDGDGTKDVQTALWALIGAGIALDDSGVPSPLVRSVASNEIYENGRYGIQFREGITGMSTSNGETTDITIQGNYIGTNTSAASGLQNGRYDYWWDANGTGSNEPPVRSSVLVKLIDTDFTNSDHVSRSTRGYTSRR